MARTAAIPRLATLFPGATTREIVTGHWLDRPAWHHGSPARLGALQPLGDLGAVVALASRSPASLKAMLQGADGSPGEVPIQAADILTLYGLGATIACNEVQRWHQGVAAWLARLRRDLKMAPGVGNCNMYVSPGDHGVPMHFDDHEVIVVQLTGVKTWRIARNTTVVRPLHGAGRGLEGPAGAYASGPAPAGMPPGRRLTMRAGSALFLPRGYWHATRASSLSISLTFGFRQPTWFGLLQRALTARLQQQPGWRATGWGPWAAAAGRAGAEKEWSALRTALASEIQSMPLSALLDES